MTIGEISVIISICGVLPYVRGIIKGDVRPARVSWFVWTVILGLALWSYRASGATDSAWLIAGDLLITAIVFVLSLWRGSGSWQRLDCLCLCLAVCGIGLWQLAGGALLGVLGVLLADAVAMVPTLVKSLRQPETESATTFIFSAIACVLGIIAVGSWDLVLLVYPVYLFMANFTTALTITISQYQYRRLNTRLQVESSKYIKNT